MRNKKKRKGKRYLIGCNDVDILRSMDRLAYLSISSQSRKKLHQLTWKGLWRNKEKSLSIGKLKLLQSGLV